MDRQFRKIFYFFGTIMSVISAMIIWRTVNEVIPAIGMEGGGLYLAMAIFFFCVGVGLLLYARYDGKKEARKAAEQAAKEQSQQ